MNAARIIAYIEFAEEAICGEIHGADWPACDHPHHDEGRSLMAALRAQQPDVVVGGGSGIDPRSGLGGGCGGVTVGGGGSGGYPPP